MKPRNAKVPKSVWVEISKDGYVIGVAPKEWTTSRLVRYVLPPVKADAGITKLERAALESVVRLADFRNLGWKSSGELWLKAWSDLLRLYEARRKSSGKGRKK